MELAAFRPLTGREVESLERQFRTNDVAVKLYLDLCWFEADLRFLLGGPLAPELRLADRDAGADQLE
jgi:hypothetical protein